MVYMRRVASPGLGSLDRIHVESDGVMTSVLGVSLEARHHRG